MAGKNFGSIAFLILFCVVLNNQPANSYNIATYNDNEAGLHIFNTLFYGDGSLVNYMVKPVNETCVEPKFYIRVIYANGTTETSTQIYSIPEFNFCKNTIGLMGPMFTLTINNLRPKHAIMIYMNSTDINSSANYGILLSINGEFISKFYIDKSSSINGIPDGPCMLTENGNFDGEFLMSNFKTNSNDYQWIHFKITKLKTGIITQAPIEYGDVILYSSHFPALDSGFGLVIANTTITENNNSTKNIKPNQPPISIYVSLIYPNKDEIVGPFLVYQTTDINLSIDYLHCASAITSSRYMCIVKLTVKNKKHKAYWMKISFLSDGAVTGTEPLEFNHIPDFTGSYLTILFYGGFLFNVISPSEIYKNKYTIHGYLLDNNLKINSILDLPSNLTVPSFSISKSLGPPTLNRNYGIFTQNNTFIAIIPNENDNKNWQLISTEVSKFLPDDKGYSNPNIDSTYPSINGVIEIGSEEINVTYNTPIVPSINNISIYQINNNEQVILRQSFPADSSYCTISDDKKSLNIRVLTSTFNLPNTKYYVVVEDGALKLSSTGQPLIGIYKNIWKFTTDNVAIKYSDSANSILRLNVEGTNLFNLDSTNRSEFIGNLKNELANLTPINPTRLSFIKDQMDYTTSPPTLLLSYKITKPDNEDLQEINVAQIISNLNTLINNKFITGISRNNYTSFIDENYGFIFTRYLFEEYKIHLIIISTMIVIIILLIWYSYKKYPEISNNYEFYEWFKKYANILAVFTIISSTEIDALVILSSKVAGLKPFSAPFSSNFLSLIFWCNLASFLIEDIPQFIIQVIYKNSIISYDLIPFLTLITILSSSSPIQEKSTAISIGSIDDDEDSKIKDNTSKLIREKRIISRYSV
ncbi:14638_t:CDS:10 [Entrophospora sp. SA101]|nr:14638_t:CDS:10 [Entrophospora sp. SA101]